MPRVPPLTSSFDSVVKLTTMENTGNGAKNRAIFEAAVARLTGWQTPTSKPYTNCTFSDTFMLLHTAKTQCQQSLQHWHNCWKTKAADARIFWKTE